MYQHVANAVYNQYSTFHLCDKMISKENQEAVMNAYIYCLMIFGAVLQGIFIAVEHKEKYVEMGDKAQLYYNENRTPQHMADGLWNAVKYAIEH